MQLAGGWHPPKRNCCFTGGRRRHCVFAGAGNRAQRICEEDNQIPLALPLTASNAGGGLRSAGIDKGEPILPLVAKSGDGIARKYAGITRRGCSPRFGEGVRG